jgi:hypothetical protein
MPSFCFDTANVRRDQESKDAIIDLMIFVAAKTVGRGHSLLKIEEPIAVLCACSSAALTSASFALTRSRSCHPYLVKPQPAASKFVAENLLCSTEWKKRG